MFNQPQNNLPVRADMPDMSAMIQGVPYQVPFVPQFQVRPQQQQLIQLITGYTINELQVNAQKNPLRCFLFNMMSAQRWQNPQFAQMVSSVGDYAEMLAAQQGVQAEAAIRQAAAELCAIMAAYFAGQFPALQQTLQPQQWTEMQGLTLRYQQIGQAIQQYQQRAAQMQQPQYGGGMPMGGQQQWQTVQQSGGHQWQGMPAANMAMPATNNWGQGQVGANQPVFHSNPPPSGRSFRTTLRADPGHKVEDNLDSVSFGAAGVNIREVVPAANFQPQQVNTVQEQQTHSLHDTPIVSADGSEVRLASKSGWNKSYNPAMPYATAFNPKTHILKHIRKPDGSVTELLEVNDPAMRYEDHELSPIFRLKARAAELDNGARIDPVWDDIVAAKPAPNKAVEIEGEEPGLKELDIPVFLENEILAHSTEEGALMARLELLQRDIKLSDGAVFEYYIDKVTPILTTGGNLIGVFRALQTIKTIPELAKCLEGLVGQVVPEAWHVMNDRLTKLLLEMLEHNVGLSGWGSCITDFANDTPELFELLQSKYGDVVTATLNARIEFLIDGALSILRGDSLTAYVEGLKETVSVETAEGENPYEGLFVLSEKVSITHVPWFGSQIDLAMKAKSGAVLESKLPELYRAMKAIVGRVKSQESLNSQIYRAMYIVTADNVKLRIHEGFMGKDFYLISVE